MENTNSILIDDEDEIMFYPATISTFGVHSKKIKFSKNIYTSFTPLSTNSEITFPTTIMYPTIKTETTTDTEKNISRFENENIKRSLKKDSTRIKTESSKDEKYNISYDKQITKILIENEESIKKEENEEQEDINIKEEEEHKVSLKTNPFFLGVTSCCENNRYLNSNDMEIEEKKVNKILNKGKNMKAIKDDSLYYKTSKNVKKNINNEFLKNKNFNKAKRQKTLIVDKTKKSDSVGKQKKGRIIKRNRTKRWTLMQSDNRIIKNLKNTRTPKNSIITSNIKYSLFKTRDKDREETVNKPSIMNIKDNNIKVYRANLFFANSSAKINTHLKAHIIRKEKIKEDEEEEEEKNHKEKKTKKKFFRNSENSLNTKLNPQTPKCKNDLKLEEKLLFHKFNTDLKMSQKDLNENINKKRKKRSQSIYQFRKLKTFTKQFSIEKKKITNTNKRKFSETRKDSDFELALKNKKNLANTQFN